MATNLISGTVAAATAATAAEYNNLRKDVLQNGGDAAVSGGAANAYTLAVDAQIAAYALFQVFKFQANFANTAACTLNVNGLGAKTIKKAISVDLDANDILNNAIVIVVYDGSNMQLVNVSSVPNQYFGDSGQLTTGALAASQDIVVSFTTGFRPRFFEADIILDVCDGNGVANDNWGSGHVQTNLSRDSLRIKGAIGGVVLWTNIADHSFPGGGTFIDTAPSLNQFFDSTFGKTFRSGSAGTSAAPGWTGATFPGGITSLLSFTNITADATHLIFTFHFAFGNSKQDIRYSVANLRVW